MRTFRLLRHPTLGPPPIPWAHFPHLPTLCVCTNTLGEVASAWRRLSPNSDRLAGWYRDQTGQFSQESRLNWVKKNEGSCTHPWAITNPLTSFSG